MQFRPAFLTHRDCKLFSLAIIVLSLLATLGPLQPLSAQLDSVVAVLPDTAFACQETLIDHDGLFFPDREPMPVNFDEIRKQIIEESQGDCDDGRVIIRLLVNREGKVAKYIILRNGYPPLANRFLGHLEALRFKPAMNRGIPICCWVTLPLQLRCLR